MGLKKAGSLGGTFSSIDPRGTRILVVPSVISIISFTLVCNQNSKIISPIMVLQMFPASIVWVLLIWPFYVVMQKSITLKSLKNAY